MKPSRKQAYRRWIGMMRRCYQPEHKSYRNYGARGITVCKRWHVFNNYYADTGDAPSGMMLDRIDNDKGYKPDNWRWATPIEQSRNSRQLRLITWRGQTKCIKDWAEHLGIRANTLCKRLGDWKDVERALSTPIAQAGSP